MAKKITHEEYVKSVAELGSGITVVGTYAGSHAKITHRCAEGHEWPVTPACIKQGHGCDKCARKKQSNRQRLTHEEYVNYVSKMGKGITVLGTYVNMATPITHRCAKGHEWNPTPSNIGLGKGCTTCARERNIKARTITHEEYVKSVAKLGSGITVVGTYAGANTPIDHRCHEGHEWPVAPSEIKRGGNCSKCCEYASDANVFYIWASSEDAGVYKVGITSERCAEERIATCSRKHDVDANIILMASVPNAREIERKALQIGEEVDYSSKIDGYTEFRRYTDQELGEVYRMAVQAA